ncbi:MAG: protein-export rane protein SecD [Sphingomonas bacterium]|uniref:protein translocase subunit SecD n=1 Tax=Sphingomonas bacterium TaxID=1895847 RepID=UPI002624CB53|nr:protein translocase subunit SecD [Sphingomonas bacterium]MDB5710271.1 protein-export rane protein SecD [Sphingomonas bacterium]
MLDFPRSKIIAIVGVLVALMLLAVPSFFPERITNSWPAHPRVSLGLDLAGGSRLLLEADVNALIAQRLEAMHDQIANGMDNASPKIAIGDISVADGQLSFMVRDPSQIDAAREVLNNLTKGVGLTGQRDWDISVINSTNFVVKPTKAGIDEAVKVAMSAAISVIEKRINGFGTKEPTIVAEGSSRIAVEVPGLKNPKELKEALRSTAKLEFKMVADTVVQPGQALPLGTQLLPYAEGGKGATILVKRRAILTGGDLASASAGKKQEDNRDIVNFSFNTAGGRTFARITQDNVGKRFAVVLDDVVISAPSINTPILGGSGYIEGSFTAETANTLAVELNSGALPINLKVIEERTIGPGLGAESIRAGITASIIAVVLVMLFMFVTYGRFGLYANLAVIINVVIIIGVMALLGSALTLPGIAGFVLTIGTAVDANVLINERIREERRRGRNVVQAVELGYKEASRTIFEANMTHAISGVIMFALGSGPVRGFAAVLLIGICTSVFTAVVFTRMLVALWIRRNRPSDINI